MTKKKESFMRRTHYTSDIPLESDGRKVVLVGHVDTIRRVGMNFIFIILRDEKGDVQIAVKKGDVTDGLIQFALSLTPESVIMIEGVVRKTEKTVRGVEILPISFEILNKAVTPLPIDFHDKSGANLSTRLDWRSLD